MIPNATSSTDTNAKGEHPAESHHRLYLIVFLALLVFTVLEYLYARFFAESFFAVLLMGLLLIAIIKAVLVGLYFMHLAFEGRWKYLVLIPTAFFSSVLVVGLLPDLAFNSYQLPEETIESPDPAEPTETLESSLPSA